MSRFIIQKKMEILTIILALAVLIASLPTQAFGVTTSNNVKASGKMLLNNTFQFYKNLGEKTSMVYQGEDRLIYDVEIPIDGGTVTSHIDTKIDEKGNQTINIKEAEKEDTLLYTADGKLYENGNLVTESVANNMFQAAENQEIVPMGARRIYLQENAPYGKNGDYTKASTTVKKNLTLSKVIKSFTVGALSTIIITALFSSGIGIGVGILSGGVTAVITYYTRNDPASKAMSMKDTVTVHKTKGFNVKPNMSTDKHKVIYYHNENCSGAISGGNSTFWRVFSY